MNVERAEPNSLGARLRSLRGPQARRPDVAVVVPVNVRGDLQNVMRLLEDLARYAGPHAVQIVLVVNNFPPGEPPTEVEELRRLGLEVLAIPKVERRPGEAICLAARIPGIREAAADQVVLFDADCRVPEVTTLLDWYVEQLRGDAHAAYTPVSFYDVVDAVSVRTMIGVHHASRWIKRNVFRIPTTRGSNYAVRRETMLELYEGGFLADDLNVGPATLRLKGPVAYRSDESLTVHSSGRMFRADWWGAVLYFMYRLRYNLRVLPVRPNAARFTGRENDRPDRYIYTGTSPRRRIDASR